jgi:hypothetical protein
MTRFAQVSLTLDEVPPASELAHGAFRPADRSSPRREIGRFRARMHGRVAKYTGFTVPGTPPGDVGQRS